MDEGFKEERKVFEVLDNGTHLVERNNVSNIISRSAKIFGEKLKKGNKKNQFIEKNLVGFSNKIFFQ